MNQKTKIFTASLVLILGAVLLSGAGCTSKVASLTGQLTTEDKCVELLALSLASPSYGQNMAALQQRADDLKKQYGWSGDDITNNCKLFANQKDFMEHLGKRMQELLSEIK